jgi:hypothetical protein
MKRYELALKLSWAD